MKHNRIKPLLIGIAGDSATGKSTLSQVISEMLNEDIWLLEGDAYHKWERKNKKWKKFTHLNFRANYLNKQVWEMRRLKSGKKIKLIGYDHSWGEFTSKKTVYPKNHIIINGLHTLYLKKSYLINVIKRLIRHLN